MMSEEPEPQFDRIVSSGRSVDHDPPNGGGNLRQFLFFKTTETGDGSSSPPNCVKPHTVTQLTCPRASTNLVSTYKFSPYDKNTSKILCKMPLFPAPISGRGLCVFSSGVWAIIPSGALFHDTKIVPKKKNASKYVLGCVLLFLGDFFTAPLCLCR